MSFLSVDVKGPATAPERQSYSADGPVPVVFGRQRIPMKLLETPWNHVPMKYSDHLPRGSIYTLALRGCWGTVEWCRFWINGIPKWDTETTRGADIYTDVSYGSHNPDAQSRVVRIYWGTHDQQPDPFLNGTGEYGKAPPLNPDGSARIHPAYSGIFYCVFFGLSFDDPIQEPRSSTTLPPIEVEVIVRPPLDTGDMRDDTGSNPIAIAHEILTNQDWGGAVPASVVPSAAWASKAATLQTDGYATFNGGGDGHISPLLAEGRDLADYLATLYTYFDGFVQLRNGSLEQGWFPNKAGDPGTLTTLSRQDFTAEPDVDPEGWEDTLSEISIKYPNAFERWGLETVTARSPYNLQVTGRGVREEIDMPWLINPWMPPLHAARILRVRAYPGMRLRGSVLRSKAVNPDGSLILPGDLVWINYEPYALQLLCRVIERTDDGTAPPILTFQNERGRWPEEYIPEVDDREIPLRQAPGTISAWKLMELPDGWDGRMWPPRVAVIAARPHNGIIYARAWMSESNTFTGEEDELDPLEYFATLSSLSAAIDEDSGTVTFALPSVDNHGQLNRSYTQAEQAGGAMLAIVGDEIMSLGTFSAASSTETTRVFSVQRGAFGSVADAHSSGAAVFLISRYHMARISYEHPLMQLPDGWSESNATLWFRLAAVTGWEEGAANTPRSVQIRNRVPDFPAIYLDSGTSHLRITDDGTVLPRLSISWPEQMDPELAASGKIELEWRLSTDAADTWRGIPLLGVRTLYYYLHDVVEGDEVKVRARYVTYYGLPGAWLETDAYHTIVGKSALPNDPAGIYSSYDPETGTVELHWNDPIDLDLRRTLIDRRIGAAGTWELAHASVDAGLEQYRDLNVYAGTDTVYYYRFRNEDTSGNIADGGALEDEWPIEEVTITASGRIPAVSASSRSAVNGGLLISVTWDAVGYTGEDGVMVKYMPATLLGLLQIGTVTGRFVDGELDIPIPHKGDGDYYVRAIRSIVRDGERVAWGPEEDLGLITVHPDEKAPDVATGITVGQRGDGAMGIEWTDSTSEDFVKSVIYRLRHTSSVLPASPAWVKIGEVMRTDDGEVSDWWDPDIWASKEAVWYHYVIVSQDRAGNGTVDTRTLNANYKFVSVAPPSAPVATITAPAAGLRIKATWSSVSANDDKEFVMIATHELSGVTYEGRTRFGDEELTIGVAPGYSGSYVVKCYRVDLYNERPRWSLPDEDTVTVPEDSEAPATPTGLAVTHNQVTARNILTWDPNSDIDVALYEVQRSLTSASSGFETLDAAPASADADATEVKFIDRNVFAQNASTGTPHYYRIRAVDNTGNASAWTTAVSATVTSLAPPIAFAAAANANGPSVDCTWTAGTGSNAGDMMEIQVYGSASGPKKLYAETVDYADGSENILIDPYDPQIGVTNGFRVRARRWRGATYLHGQASGWTSEISLTIAADTTAPPAPTGFAYSFDAQGASLEWTPVRAFDLDHIEVQRKYASTGGSGGDWKRIAASAPGGAYDDLSVRPNTNAMTAQDPAYYRIRAVDKAGNASVWAYNDADAGRRTTPGASAITDKSIRFYDSGASVDVEFTSANRVIVEVEWNGGLLAVDDVRPGLSGTGVVTVHMPPSAPAGSYTVVARAWPVDEYGNIGAIHTWSDDYP